VPHVHVHLIPINRMDDMRFLSKVTLTKEEFQAIALSIQENL
jgi:histidine triad (HIT) family protein